MALFRPAGPIGAISGSVGSLTFVARQQRPIVRARQLSRTRITQPAINARAAMKHCVAQWTALLASRKLAWATLASTIRWTDSLGQARQPSGRALFISHNLELTLAGQTIDTNTLPVVYDASAWTGGALVISGAQTAQWTPVNPLFGPYTYCNLYIQTFYTPLAHIADTTFEDITGRIPQRWKFLGYRTGPGNAAFDLYPAAAAIIGPLAVGQRLALKARWVQTGYMSAATHTSIATRP